MSFALGLPTAGTVSHNSSDSEIGRESYEFGNKRNKSTTYALTYVYTNMTILLFNLLTFLQIVGNATYILSEAVCMCVFNLVTVFIYFICSQVIY